ncbi:hypothetical protein BTA51_07595 [Hahella sp. CCB-MM4]|uniref:DUF4892 domain-containing protein n=1 Tax=Hahella sp. (strain CCB-MM4) TaxID=1926491 RepID=UPI000BD0F3DB|nr:DUF4892 domain-containing protein [Hahella sp. CCB-MM4]OZG73670.1 hypothetical protein BTA51_07595 [Hahella sp. CCB-MM4]
MAATMGMKTLMLVLVGLLSMAANAVEAVQVPLQPFPLSKVVESRQQDIPEYRLITGPLSSIGAIVRAEQEEIVKGKVSVVTYEVPRVHTPREVMEHYLSQIAENNARILFRCEGRDCGRSNDWANEIFEERILYGHDRYQYYTVASFTKGGVPYVGVIYTIRRGNQRIYAHTEFIELSEPYGAKKSDSDRYLMIPASEISETRTLNEKLNPWLEKVKAEFKKPQIVIVTYSKQASASELENLEEAKNQGRIMQLYLARQAVPESSIEVIAVGPFASESVFSEHKVFVRIYAVEAK